MSAAGIRGCRPGEQPGPVFRPTNGTFYMKHCGNASARERHHFLPWPHGAGLLLQAPGLPVEPARLPRFRPARQPGGRIVVGRSLVGTGGNTPTGSTGLSAPGSTIEL